MPYVFVLMAIVFEKFLYTLSDELAIKVAHHLIDFLRLLLN